MKGPRVIKTHLPVDMLPKNVLEKAKIVFVARNPMDCCVSFFHHERLVPKQGFLGTFEQYANLFRNGRNPMGDYWYHLKVGENRILKILAQHHLFYIFIEWLESSQS